MFNLDRLLDPAPMPLEMGYERLPNGVLHIAVRTDMRGCSGDMLTWWFGSRPGTREYAWWHPIDHTSSQWREGEPGEAIGSIHVVTEKLTNLGDTDLLVQFTDPREFFSAGGYDEARTRNNVSAAVCGHTGIGHDAPRTPDGKVLGGRLLHIGRDTEWGLALRSHFFLGYDLPATGAGYEAVVAEVPDVLGPNLLQHCYDEFTFLSRILPPLYTAENRDKLDIPRPW